MITKVFFFFYKASAQNKNKLFCFLTVMVNCFYLKGFDPITAYRMFIHFDR